MSIFTPMGPKPPTADMLKIEGKLPMARFPIKGNVFKCSFCPFTIRVEMDYGAGEGEDVGVRLECHGRPMVRA